MSFPEIDPAIQILPGTDLDDVWDRFEVFEALHHSMTICNPMTSEQLDELIAALTFRREGRVLDVACGYGELLLRASRVAEADGALIRGVGIDLSPWMITRAHQLAAERAPGADIGWVIGEARDYHTDPPADIAVCIGAEWVWHDFRGTARALAERVVDGGQVVIGAARLHHAANADAVAKTHGVVDTIDTMAAALHDFGLVPVERIDPDDAGWDEYLARTADAVETWAERFPGERAAQWVADQAEWQAARERDREVIGWSVWVAQKSI